MNMASSFTVLWIALAMLAMACGQAQTEPAAMTLEQALQMAAARNPNAEAAEARIERAQGEYRQARLWPNPELEAGLEGVTAESERSPGSGAAERPDQQQTVVSLKQPLPIAGGRLPSQKAAKLEVQYREHMREAARIEIEAQVKKAFLHVLHAQQAVQTHRDMADRLEQIVAITKARFDSGDIAESELLRAQANHSRFLLDVTDAREKLEVARLSLAQSMGCPDLDIGECQGALDMPAPALDWAAIEKQLAEHPRAAALDTLKDKAEQELLAEKGKRFPGPALGLGYRHYKQTGQDTVDASIGIELPLFDRRQGAVAAARAGIREAEARHRLETQALAREMLALKKRHEYLARKIDEFDNAILPKMTECLSVSRSAFNAGGNSMIEVLDAYRALAETRLGFLDANKEHCELLIDLDALAGQQWFKP